MLKRTLFVVGLLYLFVGFLSAQEEVDTMVMAEPDKGNDTWTRANITDDMTIDPDQNKLWREGNYFYSSRPKNAWELGIHGGHFQVNGDVPSDVISGGTNLFSGYGVGLHLRKAINYVFSWRADIMYSSTKGLDGRPSNVNVIKLDNTNVDLTAYPNNSIMYRNFHSRTVSGGVSVVVNIGNLLFHKERNKWNFYTALGLFISNTNVDMDYFDENDDPYDWSQIQGDFPKNTREKRKEIRKILDGTYESGFENDRDVTSFLFDNGEYFPSFTGAMGISRKINKRLNISLEHMLLAQDYDKWDGHEYRSIYDQTNDSDLGHYTSLRIAFNLANFDKATEPLYWLNPIDNTLNDIADLKLRPELDLTDSDGDGVIDMLDQEIDTPVGAPVDTRGVALDSDGDGLADYLDDEPYSDPALEVDEKGVGIGSKCEICTEEQVINLINNHLAATACGEWFLPMINFDLDKYYIKPEFYRQLHHVAEILDYCPNANVVAYGHTDVRNSNQYNMVLSFNRATAAKEYLVRTYNVDPDRIMVMYGGEEAPLVPNLPDNHNINKEMEMQQYINRRVEFRIAKSGDKNMERPEGPDAGSGTPHSSRSGVKYSGNSNSGY
jgi:outer membrane protein OmpA-like peptidoglycan-associated protein